MRAQRITTLLQRLGVLGVEIREAILSGNVLGRVINRPHGGYGKGLRQSRVYISRTRRFRFRGGIFSYKNCIFVQLVTKKERL